MEYVVAEVGRIGPVAKRKASELDDAWAAGTSAAGGAGGGVSAVAELADLEKLERRVRWLNRSAELAAPMDVGEVLLALDSVGFQHAMRVLRLLEDNVATVPDPTAFVKDSVARSGWIWAKPDAIDDDEKVAKRVSWLNQFAGLAQPIDFARVADVLDDLKVPHAMELLREVELQAHQLDDPTGYLLRSATLAGVDGVHLPAAEESPAAQWVSWLNESGALAIPIEVSEVADGLARVGDECATRLLTEVKAKGKSLKDPTGYIKFKLNARLAALGAAAENLVGNMAAETADAEDSEDAEEAEEEAEAWPAAKLKLDSGGPDEAPVPRRATQAARTAAPRRAVGGLTGYSKLVPRPAYGAGALAVKAEAPDKPELHGTPVAPPVRSMPMTPQEKLVQVRGLALKHGLQLDPLCLKGLARLPFYKAKDMIDDVLLGGRSRQGVKNDASRYLTMALQQMSAGLGAEQGIAMDLAVSLGVVLNNDALDELACVPRKESQSIIRQISKDPRADPLKFIQEEVLKCRAQLDARPCPPRA